MSVRLLSESPSTDPDPQLWPGVLTHSHTYSGRADHGGAQQPPDSYTQIARWTARVGAAAVAMGSPWTPASVVSYGRYDGDERDTYYDPAFDKRALLETAEVAAMLDAANHRAGGRPLFFLDNETPKGRYGHMWWVGWNHDFPAWHDYDQDFDRWMVNEATRGDYSNEPMPYLRRPYLQILAEQRAAGALGFWAHPTSWWHGERGQFITNIAAEMPAHAIADGYLDGLVIMGYHPYRPQYLALWHDLLDRGYRVPGVAEMDVSLSDKTVWARSSALLTHVGQAAASLTLPNMIQGMAAGRMFVSSGPRVSLSVDGVDMGQVAPTAADRIHRVVVEVHGTHPGDGVGRLQLVGAGGHILWQRNHFDGGRLEFAMPGLAARGYLIARVFGVGDENRFWRDVRSFAVSNPVYLHGPGEGFNAPATTQTEIVIDAASEFVGGELHCETAGGQRLSVDTVSAGTIRVAMPASGRVRIISPTGRVRTDYLVNANAPLQDALRYLYRGRFLEDRPELQPGEVPPEVWPWERIAAAMAQVRLVY